MICRLKLSNGIYASVGIKISTLAFKKTSVGGSTTAHFVKPSLRKIFNFVVQVLAENVTS
jgi:hypothetical protein